MSKTKLPRLSKLMTNGEKAGISRDFQLTFTDVDKEGIDADSVFEWAVNTRALYDWFYARVERRADELLARGEHFRMFNEYRPGFMEWTPWEMIPCAIADFLRGLVRQAGHEWLTSSKIIREVSLRLFSHYRSQWVETRKPSFTVVTLKFYHDKHVVKHLVNTKLTDEQIRGKYVNRKTDDAQFEMSRVVDVVIERYEGRFDF